MMRIAMVCPYSFDEPGGVQSHVLDIAEFFRAQGHSVGVIGPCSPTTEVPEYVFRGGPAIPIAYNGSVARLSFGPQVLQNLRDFQREGQFDIWHIHEPNSPSYSLAALRWCDGPFVATYHASCAGSRLLKLALPVLRPSLEKISAGIAVSEMARRWQVEQLGGDPVLIPNGVAVGRYQQAALAFDDRVQQPLELVFVGRLDEPRKGLGLLLQAFRRLRQQGLPITLTVIGSGTVHPEPGVRYVGRVSDEEKAEILGRASVYIAPNTGGESFGIVLVEAMAAGAAVVASNLEAFAAVADGAAALFRVNDVDDLTATLRRVIVDTEYRQRLVAAGSSRAADFDWQRVGTQVLRVYETVLAGGR